MTNAERFKTAPERRDAYQEFVRQNGETVEEFFWLELEYKVELKPCPFCGGEAKRSHQWTNSGSNPVVRCKQCGAMTELCKTGDEAIGAWNRRTP